VQRLCLYFTFSEMLRQTNPHFGNASVVRVPRLRIEDAENGRVPHPCRVLCHRVGTLTLIR